MAQTFTQADTLCSVWAASEAGQGRPNTKKQKKNVYKYLGEFGRMRRKRQRDDLRKGKINSFFDCLIEMFRVTESGKRELPVSLSH